MKKTIAISITIILATFLSLSNAGAENGRYKDTKGTMTGSDSRNHRYLVQGWFKKRWPPQDSNTQKERKSHLLWMLEYQDTKILLEKIDKVRQ